MQKIKSDSPRLIAHHSFILKSAGRKDLTLGSFLFFGFQKSIFISVI
jgi:hypothetical protein